MGENKMLSDYDVFCLALSCQVNRLANILIALDFGYMTDDAKKFYSICAADEKSNLASLKLWGVHHGIEADLIDSLIKSTMEIYRY